nr:MAG TPA: hypothetical protein [Caudoviricetes sp.]
MARSCAIRNAFHSGNHDPNAPRAKAEPTAALSKRPGF